MRSGCMFLFIINSLLLLTVGADDVEVTTFGEPEGGIGCPPPDFKISRSRSVTTEQPLVTFETTQLYLPQNFSTADLEIIENRNAENNAEERFDGNRKESKYKENPFWLEDIIRHTELINDRDRQHNPDKMTKRAKRGLKKHLNRLKHGKSSGHHHHHKIEKRNVENPNITIEYEDKYVDVIPNYLNENDTKNGIAFEHILIGNLKRVKRKSGKTTSALNRPKGSSDSKAKSSGRKQHGQIDEEGFSLPDSEEDSHSHEKEKDSEEIDESPEISVFREVSEVRFPAEVGPLGGHRICKIKCVDGYWMGPLCAEQDETGQLKFEPLYKRCVVDQIPVHLQLSYKNVTVTTGWNLPHGHALHARCQDLGLYKLLGDSKIVCSNGQWAPKMPSCVPTTLLTNYSDDSPPSIRLLITTGSAAYEPNGMLAVLPGSTLHLDCMYPRKRGSPEWTWTGWFRQYLTGWSAIPDEKASRYRLSIKDIQNQDSGTYTCASPRGLTNSVSIVVAVSQCPSLTEPAPPLSLRLEGTKLGQRALYRCPTGYMLQGTANATCLASGNWSAQAPMCIAIQCPPLFLEDPNLSLVELNTSAWGRAVFRCNWGYRLSGPSAVECEPNGHWSGPLPRCRAIQCPQPLIPSNGKIDGTSGATLFGQRRYAVGALVTFSCADGHLLVGETSIVCTENGIWSAPPPFCKSQCAYPGDPPNGLIAPLKFFYDPGDFLTVQCRPGFVEQGKNGAPPDRPKCLPDGSWSAEVPHCQSFEEV